MSNYFSYLPNVYTRSSSYRSNSVDPDGRWNNNNRRIKIREELDDVILGFSQYTIKNNQRPDQVAKEFYGDDQFDWVVLLCNNILNLYEEWPMTELELENYIDSEYGTQQDSVHHWVTQKITDSKGRTLLKDGIQVPENFTYRRPDGTVVEKADTVRPISVYDYESEKNEYKRNIYLLRKDYLTGFVEEFSTLVKYLPNGEIDDETNTKRSRNTIEEKFQTVKPTYSTNIGQTSSIDFAVEQDYSSRTFAIGGQVISAGDVLADGSTVATTTAGSTDLTTTSNQYGTG